MPRRRGRTTGHETPASRPWRCARRSLRGRPPPRRFPFRTTPSRTGRRSGTRWSRSRTPCPRTSSVSVRRRPQRTWGEQILHIAQANVIQMGRLGGRAAAPDVNMKATSRAEILKALSDSFDFGTAVLQEQTDATMVQQADQHPVRSVHGTVHPRPRRVLRHRAHVGHLRADGRLSAPQRHHAAGESANLNAGGRAGPGLSRALARPAGLRTFTARRVRSCRGSRGSSRKSSSAPPA